MGTRFNTYDNAVPVVVLPEKSYVYNERYFTGDRRTKNPEDSIGFRCIIYPNEDHSGFGTYEVTDLLAEAVWTDDLDQASMELVLTLWDPVVQGSRDLNVINKGDKLELYVRDYGSEKPKPITSFVIWEVRKGSTAEPTIELTCYDELIYLLKSEDNFLFNKKTSRSKKGWTATEITEFICKKYGIPKGFIPKAKHRIPYFRVDGGTPYEILLKAWTEERKNTDVRYIIRSENGRLVIKPKDEQKEFWQIRSGDNLIDISYTDSLEGMFSAVRAISLKQEGDVSTDESSSNQNKKSKEDQYANPDGGNWYVTKAKWFNVTNEGVTCSDPSSGEDIYAPTTKLQGFAELMPEAQGSNPGDPLIFPNALGGLSCGQKIEVRYKGQTIVLPKVSQQSVFVDGCAMSLTKAAMAKLVGSDNLDKKPIIDVEWRLAGGIEGKPSVTEVSGGPVQKASADVIAVHPNMVESYGYMQKLVTLDPGVNNKAAAKLARNALNEASRQNYDAELTCYFLPFLRAGDPVHVIDEGTGLNGRYYCSDVRHTLAATGSRTSVGLNWLDVVPSLEIVAEERQPPPPPTAAGGNNFSLPAGGYTPGSSGCGGAVLAFAKTYVGKVKYVLGGGSINNISGGTDCSGFTEHVWWKVAQVSIGSWTGTQKDAGMAVAKGKEQEGDLVFFGDHMSERGGHVALWMDKGVVIECGGRVRPSGVGISRRTDWNRVRRVSHLCKDMQRPGRRPDDAGSSGTGPLDPSGDTKAPLLTRITHGLWLPLKWRNRDLRQEFGQRWFWIRDDYFETADGHVLWFPGQEGHTKAGTLAVQRLDGGPMVAVQPYDVSEFFDGWRRPNFKNLQVPTENGIPFVLSPILWNQLKKPGELGPLVIPQTQPLRIISLQGIKEFRNVPQGPLSATQQNILRTGNYTLEAHPRSDNNGNPLARHAR